MALLVISKILGLVNTLTGDYKYSLDNIDKLPQPIHMQLSEEKKHFVNVLVNF